MVRQDRFLSARALTARMRNLYGMRAGRTTVNNRLLSRGYRAYRPTTKPLLTANHRRLRLEWAQRWRNLTVAHWQHVIFGDESRFQLYPVDGRLRVRRLPGERFRPGCQAHRVQAGGGSVHVWGAFHNSAKSPLVLPDGYLTGVLYRGILQNTLVPFARHYFGDNYRYQDDNATPHRARVVLDFLAGQCHKDGAASKIARLLPHRTSLGWIGPSNQLYGQSASESWWASPGPAGWMGANPCTTPSAPCSKYASTTSGDYRRERREYPILTWHTQNETTRQRHEKNHICSTKFTTIIFQWHLGMHIRPITQNKKKGIKYI